MNAPVCIYCGERLIEIGSGHSRHPDLCASCSSLVDGLKGPFWSDTERQVEGRAFSPEESAARAAA